MNSELICQQSRCIAHELRNHISICELYSEIIKKHLDKERIHNSSIDNALNCIKKSLKIMCNCLLDLKSLNNLKQEKIDLKTSLEAGIQLSTVYIHDKDIKIKANLKDSAIVYIDENKFLACIVNIIKNAIEAIEVKGEIKVSTEVNKEYAFIKITNNGSKISKEKQNEIFKEGFTTKQTGSGLGLHICSANLKAQNAELSLLKSDDKETVFEIKIPLLKES